MKIYNYHIVGLLIHLINVFRFTKFRRGEPLPSDVEMLNLTNQTSDDDNDVYVDKENEWMARQLEAELLGGGDSSQEGNSS